MKISGDGKQHGPKRSAEWLTCSRRCAKIYHKVQYHIQINQYLTLKKEKTKVRQRDKIIQELRKEIRRLKAKLK